MANPFPGRRESAGLGKEATPGTSVVPTYWQRHMGIKLDPKTKVAQNTSAMGIEEDVNDSVVTEQWAEGSLNGKAYDLTHGLILLNILGSESVALHSGETLVADHTFTRGTAPALTLCRVNPVVTRRYALCYQTDYELTITQGEFAMFTSSIVSKIGATASDTAAYVAENAFTSKHLVAKLASTTAGIGAATALDVKSVKLKITRKRDRWTPMGAIDPTSYDPNEFSVTGELVARYTDTTLEAIANANTAQALSIALLNTDVTIGSAARPGLSFLMPKIRLTPQSLDDNLNQVLNQTFPFTAEFDTTTAAMISAVLINTRTTAY